MDREERVDPQMDGQAEAGVGGRSAKEFAGLGPKGSAGYIRLAFDLVRNASQPCGFVVWFAGWVRDGAGLPVLPFGGKGRDQAELDRLSANWRIALERGGGVHPDANQRLSDPLF